MHIDINSNSKPEDKAVHKPTEKVTDNVIVAHCSKVNMMGSEDNLQSLSIVEDNSLDLSWRQASSLTNYTRQISSQVIFSTAQIYIYVSIYL